MAGNLTEFVSGFQQSPIPRDASEEAAKFAAILPVLDYLGWRWSDLSEVMPEYRVGERRVDFCLRLHGRPRVFLEAKKPAEDLGSSLHQEQLLDYAFREGVELAVLTNGIQWWLYLPAAQGSWEQRKFFVVDLVSQEATLAAEHLLRFLSKEAVSTGGATSAAREMLDSAKRGEAIQEALPVAWNRLATEPDELLSDLLAEAVEALCGHRPGATVVAEFLSRLAAPPPRAPSSSRPTPPPTAPGRSLPTVTPPPPPASRLPAAGFTGTIPIGFTLFGTTHAVRTWKEVLLGVANALLARHGDGFEQVLAIRGRKRLYFALEADALFEPSRIGESQYFAETNLSANDIVKRCRELLKTFGHDPSALEVSIR